VRRSTTSDALAVERHRPADITFAGHGVSLVATVPPLSLTVSAACPREQRRPASVIFCQLAPWQIEQRQQPKPEARDFRRKPSCLNDCWQLGVAASRQCLNASAARSSQEMR